MPIAFIFDENLRGKPLWRAIIHQNLGALQLIDATRVGELADLPRGSLDSEILAWADRADRIILTEYTATFPAELAAHLRWGRTSPGIFLIRPDATAAAVLHWLELVTVDNQLDQWRDQVTYIP
jgi:hypothetical protein